MRHKIDNRYREWMPASLLDAGDETRPGLQEFCNDYNPAAHCFNAIGGFGKMTPVCFGRRMGPQSGLPLIHAGTS